MLTGICRQGLAKHRNQVFGQSRGHRGRQSGRHMVCFLCSSQASGVPLARTFVHRRFCGSS